MILSLTTVAILAQGTHRAVATSQAFLLHVFGCWLRDMAQLQLISGSDYFFIFFAGGHTMSNAPDLF